MTAQTIKKNAEGHNYKYTDLSAVNEYIASLGEEYYQYTETVVAGDQAYDYIHTVRIKDGNERDIRGCKVINGELHGISNSAQEAGSGLTYARRYSLYMAYGLATEDDDAQCMTKPKQSGTDFGALKAKYAGMTKDELRREYVVVNTSGDYSDKQKTAILKLITEAQARAKE